MSAGVRIGYQLLLATWLAAYTYSLQASDIEPVHYAYSNYLGSGVYHTTGQDVTLINLPFSFQLATDEQTTYSLRAPISFGFFDFNYDDIPELDFPDGVGTLTFTPGVQFDYQYTDQHILQSYIDLGYARNFTTHRDVFIHSMGISSLYSFNLKNYDAVWASRLYYAAYNGHNYEAKDSYAAVQVGIDVGLPLKYQWFGYQFQPRIFASTFWYFSEVSFDLPIISNYQLIETRDVTLSNSFELGITIKLDKTIGYDWAGIDTVGLSYRFSEHINVVRFLFSFPI